MSLWKLRNVSKNWTACSYILFVIPAQDSTTCTRGRHMMETYKYKKIYRNVKVLKKGFKKLFDYDY